MSIDDHLFIFFIYLSEWIEKLCKLHDKYGNDCWWELPVEKLVGKKLLAEYNLTGDELEKGQVTLFFFIILYNLFESYFGIIRISWTFGSTVGYRGRLFYQKKKQIFTLKVSINSRDGFNRHF